MSSPVRGSLLVLVALLLVAGLLGLLGAFAAGPPARSQRLPWTTSRVVGSPDPPPPFKVVRVFPNLKFHPPADRPPAEGGSTLRR